MDPFSRCTATSAGFAATLELVERALENSSRAGGIILDLFLGSGTTIVAAERTGRVCYGLELDPHYCRVAIARWEAFSGDRAKMLRDKRKGLK